MFVHVLAVQASAVHLSVSAHWIANVQQVGAGVVMYEHVCVSWLHSPFMHTSGDVQLES
jgi:hypothetical protein